MVTVFSVPSWEVLEHTCGGVLLAAQALGIRYPVLAFSHIFIPWDQKTPGQDLPRVDVISLSLPGRLATYHSAFKLLQ